MDLITGTEVAATGSTAPRAEGDVDPRTFDNRLITILRNMTTTINAMITSDPRIGAVR